MYKYTSNIKTDINNFMTNLHHINNKEKNKNKKKIFLDFQK